MQKAKELLQSAVGAVSAEVEGEREPLPEPDSDLGHADVPRAHRAPHGHAPPPDQRGEHPWPAQQHHASGPLERMRESAAHAVEGVKLRLHLGTGTGGGGGEPTAEQRTGEPMHMAKAAEGRNAAVDDPVTHALHDALKPEPGERAEASAFPETLGDALAVAQMRDLPNNPGAAAAVAASATAAGDAAAAGVGADGGGPGPEQVQPSPFTAQERRSKL